VRIHNYIKTVPKYLKIAAIVLVTIYVGKNTDSWFNFTLILGVPCVAYGSKQEMIKAYLHG
jgi:hypothetical protein